MLLYYNPPIIIPLERDLVQIIKNFYIYLLIITRFFIYI